MLDVAYTVELLPLFESDLQETLDYISGTLANPWAADDLLEAIMSSIRERASAPLAYSPYPKGNGVSLDHYRIYVDNYTVFYRVEGSVMVVERLIYSRRDLPKFLS